MFNVLEDACLMLGAVYRQDEMVNQFEAKVRLLPFLSVESGTLREQENKRMSLRANGTHRAGLGGSCMLVSLVRSNYIFDIN